MNSLTCLLLSLAALGAVFYGQTAQADTTRDDRVAAKRHAVAGQQAFQNGQFEKAIEELSLAVKLDPNQVDYHSQLATAYFQNNQLSEMWVQLRAGAKLDFSHPQIAKGMMAYWKMFDQQGLFNLGNDAETIRRVLGEPDLDLQSETHKDRRRFVYGYFAVDFRHDRLHESLDLRGLKPEHFLASARLTAEMDGRKWQPAYRVNNQRSAITEYTVNGQPIQKWTELVSVQRLHRLAENISTIEEVAQGMMQNLKKSNPDAKHQILQQDDDSLLMTWSVRGTGEPPPQREIVRLFKTNRDVYRFAYVNRSAEMDDATRERWTRILAAATIEPVTKDMLVNSSTGESFQQRKDSNDVASEESSDETVAQDSRITAWQLGSALSKAAMLHAREDEPSKAQIAFKRAQEIAGTTGVEIPEFKHKKTGNSTLDTTNSLSYCLADAGPVIFEQLVKSSGDDHAALFEVALKSNWLVLLYRPHDSMAITTAEAIAKRAPDAGIPQEYWQPLVEAIKAGHDQAKIVQLVSEFDGNVRKHLSH